METSRLAPRCAIILLALATAVPGSAAASGFRFFAGSDLSFEHQESLRIAGVQRDIRVRDDLGSEEESTYREDPALLNRKFDLLLELDSASVDLALDLPGLLLPGAFRLQPTLLLQAGVADVDLDFRDRTLARDSTSLGGRGPLFGTSLELAARCASCPWLVSTEYRFQRLPRMTVDRTPSFDLPFEILADEVRLERDVQEASTRIGYGFSNGILSYVGASHRWSDVEIEDGLRYVDLFGTETTLSSRFELDSEVTLGIAGVETRLGKSFRGKIETLLSEEDWVVRAQVVYRAPGRIPSPSPGTEARQESEEERRQIEKRAQEIDLAIAPGLAAVREAFLAGWRNLQAVEGPDGQPAYLVREVDDLLRKTEREIRAVLRPYPELEALADWVSDELSAARKELKLPAPPQVAGPVDAAYAALQTSVGTILKELVDAVLGGTVDKDIEKLQREPRTMKLRFETSRGPLTTLLIHPRYEPGDVTTLVPGSPKTVWRGSYAFRLGPQKRNNPRCGVDGMGTSATCPLNLLDDPCPVLRCDKGFPCKQEGCL